MLYRKSLRLLLALALLAPAALAQEGTRPAVPDTARLRAHVAYLASEKLEGRRTGTPGAQEAARYIAAEFRDLGLLPFKVTPSGEGPPAGAVRLEKVTYLPSAYMQEFPYVAGVELGGGNALTVTRRVGVTTEGPPVAIDFRVGEDWMPLGFGSNARVEGALVFAGYGITAAEQNHDDYRGADVKGKFALAFAGTPDGDGPHGRFTRAGEPRFKAAAARAAGAGALVLVAAEEEFKNDRLSRLSYDNAGDAGLPVVAVSRQAAARLLGLTAEAQLREAEAAYRGQLAAAGAPGVHAAAPQTLKGELRGRRLALATNVVRRSAPAANVVGVLEGSDPHLKSEVIVVGAHYDHLGRGGGGSLAGREGEVHYGADDNASGTAGLLELARLFSQQRARLKRTLVFVAFGGEEEGLIGSSFYVQNPARPLEQTVAMLNMDMIGRLRAGALNVGGVGTAAELRSLVEEANRGYKVTLHPSVTGGREESATAVGGREADARIREGGGPEREARVNAPAGGHAPIVVTGADGRTAVTATPAERFALRLSEDGYGPSDHSSFYARRVPVLFFFTGVHDDYHKPSDTAERVNYEGQALVVQFVRDIAERLQAAEKRLTYAVARSEPGARAASFRVSLGTVPAYGESTDGLRLEAVREGSPAAAAGLKAGDRIVKLAGRDVRNVHDYTQALTEMKAGQEYEVEAVREGQRLTLKITPAARK